MTKIRLARRGRKHRPVYSIVVADARAPRDGKFIEKVGTYDPHTRPGEVDMETDRVLFWLGRGAQPAGVVRSFCVMGGIMLLRHLQRGISKGSLTKAIALERFAVWQKRASQRTGKKRVVLRRAVSPVSLIGTGAAPG